MILLKICWNGESNCKRKTEESKRRETPERGITGFLRGIHFKDQCHEIRYPIYHITLSIIQ